MPKLCPAIESFAADLAAGSTTSLQLTEAALARAQDPAGEGARVFTLVDAERARAWRQRQRELIAAAKAAEPLIVEKVVEVERIVEKRVASPARISKKGHFEPNASNLFPLLKERFTGFQGEENA